MELLFIVDTTDTLFLAFYGLFCAVIGIGVLAFFSQNAHDFLKNYREALTESKATKILVKEIQELKVQNKTLIDAKKKVEESNDLLRDQNSMFQAKFEMQEAQIKSLTTQYQNEISNLRKLIEELQNKVDGSN